MFFYFLIVSCLTGFYYFIIRPISTSTCTLLSSHRFYYRVLKWQYLYRLTSILNSGRLCFGTWIKSSSRTYTFDAQANCHLTYFLLTPQQPIPIWFFPNNWLLWLFSANFIFLINPICVLFIKFLSLQLLIFLKILIYHTFFFIKIY